MIPLHNKKVRSGSLTSVPTDLVPRWMVWVLGVPQSVWLRGVLFGLIGVVVFSLPTLGLLAFILVMPMMTLAMNTAATNANINHD